MKCNRLALSVSKTNFILFHSSKHKNNQSLRMKIDDALIKQVGSTKYLGLTFDSNLTWKSHVNELCLKLSKTVGVLSKVKHFVDNHILVMLYYSLTWDLTFRSFLTQLFIIQKKAIRIISFSEPISILSLCSNLSTYFSSMSLNHRYSLLFIGGHADCYPPVSVNISNLILLFIRIQRGNHVIEIFM